jgi:hypothetical protein
MFDYRSGLSLLPLSGLFVLMRAFEISTVAFLSQHSEFLVEMLDWDLFHDKELRRIFFYQSLFYGFFSRYLVRPPLPHPGRFFTVLLF